MGIMNISGIDIIVSVTASAAIKLCPALFAFRFRIYMRAGKCSFQFIIKCSVIQAAHFIIFNSYKLMTWINISVRRYSNIFVSAAAAP